MDKFTFQAQIVFMGNTDEELTIQSVLDMLRDDQLEIDPVPVDMTLTKTPVIIVKPRNEPELEDKSKPIEDIPF